MPDGNRKPEGGEIDPAKLLELELMQKRAEWQQAKTRRGGLRALSFLFLAVIIAAAVICFYLFFSPERVRELRSGSEATPSAAPTEP
jgi:flagellar basal body-associated protein FliL